MQLLLSFITSSGVKWLSILIIVAGLAGSVYMKHRQIVELEKKTALQEYNIKQLQQSIKDRDILLDQMQSIAKNRDEEIASLEKQKQALDNKLKAIESAIDVEVGKGNDRPSSNILKNTIRELSQ